MTRLMRLNANESDFVMPIDIDEFLVLTNGGGQPPAESRQPTAISVEGMCDYLAKMPLDRDAYKVHRLAPAVIREGGTADFPREATLAAHEVGVLNKWRLAKTFFSTHRTIPLVDQGFHMGTHGAPPHLASERSRTAGPRTGPCSPCTLPSVSNTCHTFSRSPSLTRRQPCD